MLKNPLKLAKSLSAQNQNIHCSAIYLDTTQKVSETIEKVQNKAIRILVSAPKKFSVTTGTSFLKFTHTAK